MDFDTLFAARDYLTLKDHKAGAIKLGVSPAILGDSRFKDITKPTVLPRGIKSVDVSVFTMSVTVQYDEAIIPHALVDELFKTRDEARGKAIVAELDKALGLDLA